LPFPLTIRDAIGGARRRVLLPSLAAALLAAALGLAGCSADGTREATLWLYHLEKQVHGPLPYGQLSCGPPAPTCPFVTGDPGGVLRYRLRGEPAVGGTDLRRQTARAAPDGRPAVLVDFSEQGSLRHASFTRALAAEGAAEDRRQHIAIVVGGEIVAYPAVEPVSATGILSPPRTLTIDVATREQAEDIAARLRDAARG
jgi:hypothetical protein